MFKVREHCPSSPKFGEIRVKYSCDTDSCIHSFALINTFRIFISAIIDFYSKYLPATSDLLSLFYRISTHLTEFSKEEK